MMLIKLFIFFLLLLILPDWYIYRAYIHRVSQKWIRRAYWIPTLFLVTGMTMTNMALGTAKHRNINRKLLSRYMESGIGS